MRFTGAAEPRRDYKLKAGQLKRVMGTVDKMVQNLTAEREIYADLWSKVDVTTSSAAARRTPDLVVGTGHWAELSRQAPSYSLKVARPTTPMPEPARIHAWIERVRP